MVSEIPFDDVFSALADVLPEKWENVILYAEYGSGSYMFKYYVDVGDGRFVQCYDLPMVQDADILAAFDRIDGILAPLRGGANDWTNLTVKVSSDGSMKADADYTDLSEGSYEYRQKWAGKYLNG